MKNYIRRFRRKLPVGKLLLLTYFILLTGLGLPLGLLAIKLNVDYRRQAETVTFKATIPPNPYNTPNFGELYNEAPVIHAPARVDADVMIDIRYSVIDPDWIVGQKSTKIWIKTDSNLANQLRLKCTAQQKQKVCHIEGKNISNLRKNPALRLFAQDAYGKVGSAVVNLIGNPSMSY